MKKIKFLDDVQVLDHTGAIEFEAKAGDKKELEDASANRWIRRGVASDDLKSATFNETKIENEKAEKKSTKKAAPDAAKSNNK